jgi:GNAT superfamily N-acetyltransferase
MVPKGSTLEIRVRCFGPADTEAVMAVVDASDKADNVRPSVSGEPLLAQSGDKAVRPEEHFLVAEAEGKAIAFSDLVREKGTRLVSRLWIRPEWRKPQIGRLLLERRLALAGGFGEPVLDIPVRASQHDVAALVQSMGFVYVRTWWRMRANLNRKPAAPRLPPGFAFRDACLGVEADRLTALVNDVFSEHWGEGHHTVEEVQYDLARPAFDPQLLVFAEAACQSVGYVWSWVSRDQIAISGDACAFIGLKARGMHAAELEVDGPNASALRLYKSRGFRESDELRWYRKELRARSHPAPPAESPPCPGAGAGR